MENAVYDKIVAETNPMMRLMEEAKTKVKKGKLSEKDIERAEWDIQEQVENIINKINEILHEEEKEYEEWIEEINRLLEKKIKKILKELICNVILVYKIGIYIRANDARKHGNDEDLIQFIKKLVKRWEKEGLKDRVNVYLMMIYWLDADKKEVRYLLERRSINLRRLYYINDNKLNKKLRRSGTARQELGELSGNEELIDEYIKQYEL